MSEFPVDQHPLPGQHPRSAQQAPPNDFTTSWPVQFRWNRGRRRGGSSYGFRMSKRACGGRPRGSFQSSVFRRTRGRAREEMQGESPLAPICTDLSAGRHATAAFPRRFGASVPRGRETRRRHAIRSIPRPRSVTRWHVMPPRFYSTFAVPSHRAPPGSGAVSTTCQPDGEGKRRSFSGLR